MKKKTMPLFVAIILLLWISHGFTLEKATHEQINQRIAERTIYGFSLNNYLINALGFGAGIEEFLYGYSENFRKYVTQEVWRWSREGGKVEDEPDGRLRMVVNRGRSNNHFHNPLVPSWSMAGLDAYIGGLHYTGESSVVWAQNPNQVPGGRWSWHDARKYFYQALTATSKTERESQFANVFRALGQLSHLIQDASVPAHVRNDIHIGFHYEKWLENIRQKNPGTFNSYISSPISFDPSILSGIPDYWAPIPIARIFDTDKYDGNNPNVTVPYPIGIFDPVGITEYTNANFFSENTIFSKIFSYPKVTSATVAKHYITDPRNPSRIVARTYYEKTDDGDTGYRLAAVNFLEDYKTEDIPQYGDSEIYSLDDVVYDDYARKLLARAVGYSAGLLEYFFRGKLQVTAVPIFYKNSIIYLRAKIKNMTPNETLTDGTLTLAYSYRPTGGKSDGSEDIWGQAPVVSSGTLLYDGEEKVIDFWLPYPIPKGNYDSAKFTLAFKGKLGNEEGAVIGKALTLGEVKFAEEWDNGFTGNYTWAHTDFNLFDQNLANGSTSNLFEGDTFIKDNIRFVGYKTARVNESFLDYDYNNGQFRGILPILITPDTYFQFKIDVMSINEVPPAPPGYTNHWQALILHFNNGLTLQYFQEGQGLYTGSKTAYLTFPLGFVIVDNIYEMFKGAGITIPEPLYLESIDFLQQLFQLEQLSTLRHQQHMEIDSIRIIEGRQN